MGVETAGRWERDLKTHLAELIARMVRAYGVAHQRCLASNPNTRARAIWMGKREAIQDHAKGRGFIITRVDQWGEWYARQPEG